MIQYCEKIQSYMLIFNHERGRKPMLYTERHNQILRYLETHSSVTVQELAKSL